MTRPYFPRIEQQRRPFVRKGSEGARFNIGVSSTAERELFCLRVCEYKAGTVFESDGRFSRRNFKTILLSSVGVI